MVKSLTEINLNYEKAISEAESLERIASVLEKIAKGEMSDSLSRVHDNWQGENADLYIQKGEKIKEKLEESAKDINRTAKTIRNIAIRTRQADLAAREIASSL